jgi:putative tryptophan/tyrosine transport system substrate-binding protein
MRRREVIGGLSAAGMAWPLGLGAQPTGRPIFGILLVSSSESGRTFTDPIRAYLEALGLVDGRNIELDFRHADGNVGRLPMIATELVARRPAVIATFGDATGLAAQGATTVIPIVAMSEDLVQAKLVKDMRHPGANITGVSIMGTELDAKRLELLAEVLPSRSTILLLADPTTHRESRPALNATAKALGLTLEEATITAPDDLDRALREASAKGVAGVNVLSSAFLFALRGRIVRLTRELRMPAIYQWPETADEGGLMAYGPSLLGAFRQVTALVVKVLKGAKPGDLPVEQPTRFALHLNLKTAKELALEVPASFLLRVDKAVE